VAGFRTVAALVLALAGTASAQTLPRLHITALGMHADKRVVVAGAPFHVTIFVHVAEQRARLDELVLPTLTNAVELGKEQRREPRADGTDFYQTLTLTASVAGEAHLTPAYIDAVDPATGKALRFSSDPLMVSVTPGAPLDSVSRSAGAMLGSLAAIVGGIAAIVLVVLFLARLRRRRPARIRATARVPADIPPTPNQLPSDDPLRDAIALVRSRGDDAAMDTLRIVLFARAGLGTGATLADAIREVGEGDPQLVRTLGAAERARFAPAAERPAATRELLRLLYDFANGIESQP
jgi:hypothetical protein